MALSRWQAERCFKAQRRVARHVPQRASCRCSGQQLDLAYDPRSVARGGEKDARSAGVKNLHTTRIVVQARRFGLSLKGFYFAPLQFGCSWCSESGGHGLPYFVATMMYLVTLSKTRGSPDQEMDGVWFHGRPQKGRTLAVGVKDKA